MELKKAQYEDIAEILKMTPEFIEASEDYRGMIYSPTDFAEYLACVILDDNYFLFIARVNGELAGGFLALIDETFFGKNIIAREKFFYVAPKFRSFRLARRMILCYVKWASSRRAIRVFISSNAGFKPEKALKLYERMGFSFSGITACKRC